MSDNFDEIFQSNYLIKGIKKIELLNRLKILLKSFKELHNQINNNNNNNNNNNSNSRNDNTTTTTTTISLNQYENNIKIISGQLISKQLLQHSDKEIKILTILNILTILQLFAPDIPYSSDEVCSFFEIISIVLRNLSTYDPNTIIGTYLFEIITSLSTVRSCSLLSFLSNQNIPDSHERLNEFFEALISSVRTEHSDAVLGHVGNILEICIHELEKYDQSLLDIILTPLLPNNKIENPAAYHLIQSVLIKCVSKLQPYISNFINHILVGGIEDIAHHGSEESNLGEDIYSIIYEISQTSSNYLLHILPNICVQLHAEESNVRFEAVKLLGRLFSSPHSNYGQQYSKQFKDYLGRFVDIALNIRVEMIEAGYLIFVHHPDLRIYLEENISKRLRDAEDQVRHHSLSRLLEIFIDDPTQLQVETVKEIAERVKDKKQEIRTIALIGLSKAYHRHISQQIYIGSNITNIFDKDYDLTNELKIENTSNICPLYLSTDTKDRKHISIAEFLQIKPEIWLKFEFIPGYVFNSWGYPDPADKHLVLQLLQERIIPKPRKELEIIKSYEDSPTSRLTSHKQHKSKSKLNNQTPKSSFLHLISISQGTKNKQEQLLWECRRAALLLQIYNSLDTTQRACFTAILISKAKIRQESTYFVNKWLETGKGQQKNNLVQMKTASFRLLQNFPPSLSSSISTTTEKKSDSSSISLEKLYQSKDKILQKLFLSATQVLPSNTIFQRESYSKHRSSYNNDNEDDDDDDESSKSLITINAACFQRDELKSRLDSKSSLGNYIARLFDTSAIYMFANIWTLKYLFFHLKSIMTIFSQDKEGEFSSIRQREKFEDSLFREICDTAEFIYLLAKHIPFIFNGCIQELEEFFLDIKKCSEQENSINDFKSTLFTYFSNIVKFSAKYLILPCDELKIDSNINDRSIKSLCAETLSYILESNQPELCELLSESVCHIIQSLESNSNHSITSSLGNLSQLCDEFGIKSTIKSLSSSTRLNANSPPQRLACDLHILSVFLSIYEDDNQSEINTITNRLLNFLKSILFNSKSKFHSTTNQQIRNNEENNDCYLLSLIGGFKLWLQLSFSKSIQDKLLTKVSNNQPSSNTTTTSSSSSNELTNESIVERKETLTINERFPSDLSDYLVILFSCLESYGSQLDSIQITNLKRQSKIREISAICLIKMLSIKSIGKLISSTEWKMIAWSFLDDNEKCRESILQTFTTLIQTHSIHPRFLTLPCLLASDTLLSRNATNALLFTIKRLNRTHAELCEKAMEEEDNLNENETNKYAILAKTNSTECIIPYLFYLLSHHPDFPSSKLQAEGDEDRIKRIYNSIKMMYTVILQSISNRNHTLSILLKQVQMISQFYCDKYETRNIFPLQCVVRIAQYILEGLIKTQFQPYAGDITLPMDLYITHDSNRKIDENVSTRLLVILSSIEGHKQKSVINKLKKKSPEKSSNQNKPEKKSKETQRIYKKTPEKEKRKHTPSSISRPRRGTTSNVSYVERGESDDEAEMEEIEDLLDQSKFSSQKSPRNLSAGSNGRSSNGSYNSDIYNERLSSGTIIKTPDSNSSIMSKKRKLSGSLPKFEISSQESEEEDDVEEEEEKEEDDHDESEDEKVKGKSSKQKTTKNSPRNKKQKQENLPPETIDKPKKKTTPTISVKKTTKTSLKKKNSREESESESESNTEEEEEEENDEEEEDEDDISQKNKKSKKSNKRQPKATTKNNNKKMGNDDKVKRGTLQEIWGKSKTTNKNKNESTITEKKSTRRK